MSVPAARIRTSSGWRDMAIQGAPGIPGYTPSARAHSGAYAITADANARFYTPPLTNDFNDFPTNPFASNGRFTVPVTGRYLIGCAITEMAAGNGSLGIILNSTTVLKRITHPLVVGADGTKPGIEIWDIFNLTAGHDLMQHSWSTGGGSTNILTWNAIRLDAPALNIVTNIPLVTSLPASPVDGQEIYYLADATNGIIWHLRYRAASASAYKWEVLGGPPLFSAVDTDQVLGPTATAYQDLATVGPSITLPLAGDYDIELGCRIWMNGNNGAAWHSYAIGGAAPLDSDAIEYFSGNSNWPPTVAPHSALLRRKTGLSAVTLTSKYKVSNAPSATDFYKRWMKATPVRVG